MRLALALLPATLALSACGNAAPAAVQPVTRIVAFGDSYADNGNIFRLLGVAPPPLYPKGRFSNGTNFVDTMGTLLGVPTVNFALGGAVTGPGRDHRPAGFDTQYRAFLAGGGPAAFPRVSGRLSPSDLVVISIGGNDARAYEQSFGTSPSAALINSAISRAPAAAGASVANAERGLNALVGAGARKIMFLGGDVSRLPEVAGRPIARIGRAFSVRYNQGVKAALARYAKKGIAVTYVDLDRIHDQVEANPAAYGLLGAGACPSACLANPALADRYLFYVDRLHLSSAGFAIVGRYAVEQLRAGSG